MISEIIEKWIKGILIDGITGNLSGLFDNVNAKVGEIASDVGSTPQAWNSGIFNMLRSLSETVVLPIAAAILALVMCHELIQMITEKNNMHDFDTSMFFRWIFKSAFAILIVSNTWLPCQKRGRVAESPRGPACAGGIPGTVLSCAGSFARFGQHPATCSA